MRSKLLNQTGGAKTYALIFDKGEEAVHELLEFATKYKIHGAQITGIGAFSDVVLGYFEPSRLHYHEIPIAEQVEVLSLIGNITVVDGNPKLHAHVVVGRSNGAAYGGHLLRAYVWPTLEIVTTETPSYLHRTVDPETGLPLLDLAA